MQLGCSVHFLSLMDGPQSELHGSGSSRACCTSGQQLQVTALAMLLGPLAPKSPPNGGFLNRDSVTEPACAQLEQSLTW